MLQITAQNGSSARISLFDAHSSEVLWSTVVEKAAASGSNLSWQISALTSSVLLCAFRRDSDSAKLETRSLRLLLAACDAMQNEPNGQAIDLLRRFIALQPKSAQGIAYLALAQAQAADYQRTTNGAEAIVTMLGEQARANATEAMKADPHLCASYLAQSIVIPSGRWGEQFALIEKGLNADPDCAMLLARKSYLLEAVGRMKDAIASAQRAVALDPDSPGASVELINALMYAGFLQSAKAKIDEAERTWPSSADVQDVRVRYDLRFGDATNLLRRIDSGEAMFNASGEEERGAIRALVAARADPTPANVGKVVALTQDVWKPGRAPYMVVQTLAAFGRVDEAYRVLDDPKSIAYFQSGGTEILFRPDMRSVRLSPRFISFAARLNLLEFWKASGEWPDFCDDTGLTYDCQSGNIDKLARPATAPRVSKHKDDKKSKM
jgi:tetratricopeptide (TPR) repeat protein